MDMARGLCSGAGAPVPPRAALPTIGEVFAKGCHRTAPPPATRHVLVGGFGDGHGLLRPKKKRSPKKKRRKKKKVVAKSLMSPIKL